MPISDKKWLITTGIALLGVLVPIAIYLQSVQQKSINFSVVSATPLISEDFPIAPLDLRIEGDGVDELFLYVVSVRNSGAEAIRREDFEGDMLITLGAESTVYGVSATKQIPENLVVETQVTNGGVTVSPLLLNPKDEFALAVLTSSRQLPDLDVRIAEVSAVTSDSFIHSRFRHNFGLTILGLSLVLLYGRLAALGLNPTPEGDKRLRLRVLNLGAAFFCAIGGIALIGEGFGLRGNTWWILTAAIPTLLAGMALGYWEQGRFSETEITQRP